MDIVSFDRVDLLSESDDFGWDPDDLDFDSLLVVVPVEDECPVDFFPSDFLGRSIFSNAFKFFSVRRARFEGLSAPVSMDLSGLRLPVCGLWVCGGQRYSSMSHMISTLLRRKQ